MPSKIELEQKIVELKKEIERLISNMESAEITFGKLKKQEIFCKALAETTPDLIWLKDPDGVYILCNSRFESLIGITELELVGKTDYDIFDTETADFFREHDHIALEEKKAVNNEETVTFASNGHQEILDTVKAPVYDGDGSFVGILGIARVITEFKKAEQERIDNINFLQNLDRINRIIQSEQDIEKMITSVLDTVIEIFQADRAFLLFPLRPGVGEFEIPIRLQRQTPDWPININLDTTIKPIDEITHILLKNEGPVSFHCGEEIETGSEPWTSLHIQSFLSMALYPKTGAPWEFGIHQCSHRKEWNDYEKRLYEEIGRRLTHGIDNFLMYRKLQENHNFLNNIIDNIPSGVIVKNPKTLNIVKLNSKASSTLGYTEKELLGKNVKEFMPLPLAEYVTRQDLTALHSKKMLEIQEDRVVFEDGVEEIWHRKTIPMLDSNGDVSNILIIIDELTEKKKAELEFKKVQERLHLFMESATDGIALFDEEDMLIQTNRAFVSFFSEEKTRQELLTMTLDDIAPFFSTDNFKKNIEEVRATETPLQFHDTFTFADHVYQLIIKIFKVGDWIGLIADDITETSRLEEQLQQAQKMDSIGRLAGGIAHDFNNMLSVIIGNSEIALNDPSISDSLSASIKEILTAASKSSELTQQLLTFARKQNTLPALTNLNMALPGMIKMLESLIGENIELVWKPTFNLWSTTIDQSQLNQIIVNLCVNARDAITDGGKITIATRNEKVEEKYSYYFPESRPGEYVVLSVSDTGSGMDETTIKKIFEPFYTTKEVGKGTGLGLSTVFGIVKQNKGFITVYSEPDLGTNFNIYLPKTESSEEKIIYKDKIESIEVGNETVLVVEDEEAILKMISIMLTDLGYTIFSTKSSAEAIKIAQSYNKKIDLLITDVIMPGMNGRQLADRIIGEYPDINILFMSGYTDEIITHQELLSNHYSFIQKPFSSSTLALKVREAIEN